jgi:hypothetical protein
MDNSRGLALLLVTRLELLSADSYWAHQASGLRGSLLRALEEGSWVPDGEGNELRLAGLIHRGFEVLERGAREVS